MPSRLNECTGWYFRVYARVRFWGEGIGGYGHVLSGLVRTTRRMPVNTFRDRDGGREGGREGGRPIHVASLDLPLPREEVRWVLAVTLYPPLTAPGISLSFFPSSPGPYTTRLSLGTDGVVQSAWAFHRSTECCGSGQGLWVRNSATVKRPSE